MAARAKPLSPEEESLQMQQWLVATVSSGLDGLSQLVPVDLSPQLEAFWRWVQSATLPCALARSGAAAALLAVALAWLYSARGRCGP
ncbi:hypothetical protein PR202_ga29254 [Eleusine coracana subsp. coracana]|uniref:Uncharacterized protein n=1 Tax=Eleusine coracana subsp. coracana TaxID=191504 RepID=A0AAV5DKN5_ELECO|nr:hypothetical protein PR202_ga29254 [Eleusine coracana subsp. coracana]